MTAPNVSTAGLGVPLFLIGTRFQAMMALAVIRHLNFGAYDLVVFHQDHQSPQTRDLAVWSLIGAARQVHYIYCGAPKLRLVWALNRAIGPGHRMVFMAGIKNPSVLALFRLRPGLRLRTFNKGSYNLALAGSFLAPAPRRMSSAHDL